MGRYDWYVDVDAETSNVSNTTTNVNVHCDFVNNNWNYIMYMTSYVWANGSEVCVKGRTNVDTTGVSQQGGQVRLGSHTYSFTRGHSAYSVECSARVYSDGGYADGNKWASSVWVTIPAKPSYTVSYNANGGTSAPGNQTKWYGENLTITTSQPTRTGYTFKGWATSASGAVTYAPGATYSGNAGLTLYAVWQAHTYTVTYNANGGTGAPGNQTKTYGVNLTLSSTKPTRTRYNFKGWATSSNATTAQYAAGGTYSDNNAVTLYAVWELAYVPPRITSFTVARCNSAGTLTESGTYCKVTAKWATDLAVTEIALRYTRTTLATDTASTAVTATGTSGTISQVIGAGKLSTEYSYTIKVYVADAMDNTSIELTLGGMNYPIDLKSGGKGVGIGKPAVTDNLLDIAYNVNLADNALALQQGGVPCQVGRTVYVGSDTESTSGWYKLASWTVISATSDVNLTLLLTSTYSNICSGIVSIHTRVDSSVNYQNGHIKWIARRGFDPGHVMLVASGSTVEVYVYLAVSRWGRIVATVLQETYRQKMFRVTLHSSTAPTTGLTPTVTATDSPSNYADIDQVRKITGQNGYLTLDAPTTINFISENVCVNGIPICKNKILADNIDSYMHGGQTIALSEKVSAQPHGIVLAWSWFNVGQYAEDFNWHFFFISKVHVAKFAGKGIYNILADNAGTGFSAKYIYLHDSSIVGHASNTAGNNVNYVLRYVVGV